MNTIRNEQIKLQAKALNMAATSCSSIGIATPIAGHLHIVGGLQPSLSLDLLVLGWLAAAVGLHLIGGQALNRLLL